LTGFMQHILRSVCSLHEEYLFNISEIRRVCNWVQCVLRSRGDKRNTKSLAYISNSHFTTCNIPLYRSQDTPINIPINPSYTSTFVADLINYGG